MLKYVFVILFAAWLRRFGLALGLFEPVILKDGFQLDIFSSSSDWLSHAIENFYKEGDFSDLTCENLIIGHGAEDIAITKDGLAFITSGLMYPPFR